MDSKEQNLPCNKLLLKLIETLNWVISHDFYDISIDNLLKDFGTTVGADHAFICGSDIFDKNLYIKYMWCNSCEGICKLTSLNFNILPTIASILETQKSIFAKTESFQYTERSMLEECNIKFIACIPIYDNSNKIHSWGIFGFSSSEVEKGFGEFDYKTLKAMGSVIGTIISKSEENLETKLSRGITINAIKEYRHQIADVIKLTDQKILKLNNGAAWGKVSYCNQTT